jgi:hypothetical protein
VIRILPSNISRVLLSLSGFYLNIPEVILLTSQMAFPGEINKKKTGINNVIEFLELSSNHN